MKVELAQRFYFEAAHTLNREHDRDGSLRVHGHTYWVEVAVKGEPDAASGMLVDLAVIRREIAVVREKLDHHLLDEVQGLGPATLENLCAYLWRQLQTHLPSLSHVDVWREASGDRCRITPD
jgi:6-pyruvoyltetrahydropterin/6-carboxytetrahydropterin synthase